MKTQQVLGWWIRDRNLRIDKEELADLIASARRVLLHDNEEEYDE